MKFVLFYIIFINNSFLLTLFKMIIFFIIQLIMFGIFTKINHIHINNLSHNKNFYKHQIITSSNTYSNSYILRLLTGGLNCQIEHHLFPSINSCHLSELSKIVKKNCKKHNIHYNDSPSLYESILSVLKTCKLLNYSTIKNFNLKLYE